MNERTFLKRFEKSKRRDALVNETYKQMLAFCNDEGIPVNEMGYDTIEQLAEAYVDRGLGMGRSQRTEEAIEAFKDIRDE